MTCTEFEKYLPDIIDGDLESKNVAHLKECPVCAELVSDLRAICSEARSLESVCEPSPRVWANIQRTLEREGLIKPVLQPGGVLAKPPRRSVAAWLLPLTALVVLGIGTALYNHRTQPVNVAENQVSIQNQARLPIKATRPDDADDEQLLAHVAPSVRATYADNLKSVNAFIQDAQEDLRQNPNDDDARHFLMEAYEQKESVYDFAMNRSME